MAIDIKSLSQLISEFRLLQSKDAITPESLGYLLQRIADLLATAGTSETVAELRKVLDSLRAAGGILCSITQGQADRNHIYADIVSVDPDTGEPSTSSGIFIQQATTERAGAMRAQQVTDLNTARNNINSKILPQLEAIAESLTALQNADKTLQSNITSAINTAKSNLDAAVKTLNETIAAIPIVAGTGNNSVMMKGATDASQGSSSAFGYMTTASGQYAHAEGLASVASGQSSHAEGNQAKAKGIASHAEGQFNEAVGTASHAEGNTTTATGQYSHTEGRLTKAENLCEHASGRNNISNQASSNFGDKGNTLFSVGNGMSTSSGTPHNAFEVQQDGTVLIPDTSAKGEYYQKPMFSLQEKLGELASGSSALATNIHADIIDNCIRISGADKLLKEGYVPYVFRLTKKRNQYDPLVRPDGTEKKKYCIPSKGWHVYGSTYAAKMSGNILFFSTNPKTSLCEVADTFSPFPDALVSIHRSNGIPYVGWGRTRVCLLDKRSAKERMIKLRLAIAFGPLMLPGTRRITFSHMVTNIVEVSLIYDTSTSQWIFSK